MKKVCSFLCGLIFVFTSTACEASQPGSVAESSYEAVREPGNAIQSTASELPETVSLTGMKSEQEPMSEEPGVMKMNVQAGGHTFTATLEDNPAVDAFVQMMEKEPVVIQMSDYSGFEKVGSIGTSLPASNSQTTTQSGDIVLYNGNQIVIFYGSNSWSYTRLGKIDDLTGWTDALGSGDVAVTFSIDMPAALNEDQTAFH